MLSTTAASPSIPPLAPSIIIEQRSNVGIITLNRPKVLNSLSIDMCKDIKSAVTSWQETTSNSSNISAFIVKGAGGKAFCAGGDVKSIYNELKDLSGSSDVGTGKVGMLSSDFFRLEYEMNYLLGTSTIPQISLWDGIVMGGGVGISVLGEYRIATEKAMFAMPETAIGLFPDVGSSAWLPHLKDGQGLYLGLTGVRLYAHDLLYTGIATHYIPSNDIKSVEDMIIDKISANPTESKSIIKNILNDASPQSSSVYDNIQKLVSKPSVMIDNKDAIKRCFHNKDNIHDIIAALQNEINASTADSSNSKWASNTLSTIFKMSPSSVKLTILQLKHGKDLDLKGCLEMEYRAMMSCMKGNDFVEGIRALLVDKDNKPVWKPNHIDHVSDDVVKEYFNKLPHELIL